jgi:tRNA pseudouridine38-40 synthase
VPSELDAEAMHRAAQSLVGRHDFACFQSVGSERESTVRTIFAIDVQRGRAGEGEEGPSPGGEAMERRSQVTIEVEGDGFLYNMVRTIAGTLVEVGRGKRGEGSLGELLASTDRCQAGQTAPAHGLALLWVAY